MNLLKKLVAVSAFVVTAGTVVAAETPKTYTKSEIEAIVYDYLMDNPQILMEMNMRLQKKMSEDAAAADREYTKKYREFLYNNPADATIGPKNAKNVIIEFSDYNCGYCKRSKQLFFQVLEQHAKANDVRYIFKEYPILGEGSTIAAKGSLAVYKLYPDQFLQYHMAAISGKRIESENDIKTVTDKFKMDWNKIKEVMNSEEVEKIIDNNSTMGARMKINGTPCYIINDEFVRGAPSDIQYINNLLKQ